MLKYLIVAILSFTFSVNSFAACSGVGCSDVKIDTLYVSENSYMYIATNGVETNLTNCVPSDPIYIRLLTSHPNFDRIYSILLTAVTADKEVTLRMKDTTGNSGECEVAYVRFDR